MAPWWVWARFMVAPTFRSAMSPVRGRVRRQERSRSAGHADWKVGATNPHHVRGPRHGVHEGISHPLRNCSVSAEQSAATPAQFWRWKGGHPL
jgi:hypothetical protein